MKTFDDRKKSVQGYMTRIQKKRRRRAIAITLTAAILALVLFVPYDTTPPDVRRYANSEYYGLIQKLNVLAYNPPKYDNNFQAALGFLSNLGFRKGEGDAVYSPMGVTPMPGTPVDDGINNSYVEVTDNQVAGVTEADIIKRSENYAYYLQGTSLSVYSIDKENSAPAGQFNFNVTQNTGMEFNYVNNTEMYLSTDCRTVTVLASGYHKTLGAVTHIINLDVSDPAHITQTGSIYFTGSYLSSRLVDGDLLLIYNYGFTFSGVDFDKPETYVPLYGTLDNMTCIPADSIVCPEDASSTQYTVVCKLDGDDLQVQGAAALLSYSQELYVSADTIYATHSYSEKNQEKFDNRYRQTAMTEITGIRYAGEGLEIVGTVSLEGRVKNQYSMDAYECVLRVVTSTAVSYFVETIYGEYATNTVSAVDRNVNLYCIDLESWEVAAEVIAFAPDGEDAQSVRFDGYNAYVCTAEVITLTDPVYFFDLSDLNNITYTDTGTIDGYSTSLIQLGDGYLLGVGYGDERQMKIEIYQEVAGKVVSVCSYEREASFSENYKSYLIDRENNLIGLEINDWELGDFYILLHFDGYQLCQLAKLEGLMSQRYSLDTVRAFLDDGWLYVFSEGAFRVQQIW